MVILNSSGVDLLFASDSLGDCGVVELLLDSAELRLLELFSLRLSLEKSEFCDYGDF